LDQCTHADFGFWILDFRLIIGVIIGVIREATRFSEEAYLPIESCVLLLNS
jgi:hypothetical protein